MINTFHYDEKIGILGGLYDERLDINKLHLQVLGILKWKEEQGLKSLYGLAQKGMQLMNRDQVSMDDCVDLFNEGVKKVSRMGKSHEYEVRSRSYLKRIGKSDAKVESDRLLYIGGYLNMLKDYLKTNISYGGKSTLRGGSDECSNCGTELIEGLDNCTKCGLLVSKSLEPASFVDIKPAGASNNSGSDDSKDIVKSPGKDKKDIFIKFQDLYLRWKGTSIVPINISPQDLGKIRKYIAKNYTDLTKNPSLTTSERNWPHNAQILIEAIRSVNSKHVVDVNLVAHQIWKRQLPVVSREFDILVEQQWRQMQEFINSKLPVKVARRLGATPGRLWRHLNEAGYECDKKEFDISGSEDPLEELWNEGRKKFGWSAK